MSGPQFDADSYYNSWAFGAGFATGVILSGVGFALLLVFL